MPAEQPVQAYLQGGKPMNMRTNNRANRRNGVTISEVNICSSSAVENPRRMTARAWSSDRSSAESRCEPIDAFESTRK